MLRQAKLLYASTLQRVPCLSRLAPQNLATKQPDADNALRQMSQWMKEGQLSDTEDVVSGLDASVDAFIGMLQGANVGKTMVRV